MAGVKKSHDLEIEIWHIFRPRPQTFCSHARTRRNIVILKKNLLSIDGCSTRVPRFVNFGVKTPEIHAPYYCSYKLIDWDMFYFHSLDGSTTTRKRLCVFGGRGRGRGLCVFGGLCVDM